MRNNSIGWGIIVSLFFMLSVSYADWPRYLGVNSDGKSSETGIAREWPKDGPKVLWQNRLGVGYGGASIQGNEVYILDRVDDKQDVLRCYALDSGKELWSKSFAAAGRLGYNGSRSTPTIGPKHVYACGPFGDVYCVDRQSHKVVWTQNLGKLYDFDFHSIPHRWGLAQSPLLHKGKVIIVLGVRRRAGLVALDAESGKKLWNNTDFHGQTYVSPTIQNVAGTEQVMAMFPRALIGVNLENGEVLWKYKGYQNRIPIPTVTALGGDRFFVTGGYRGGSVLIKIQKEQGNYKIATLAQLERGAQIHPGVLVNEHIYVNFNENANLRNDPPNLACVHLGGKIVWESKEGPAIGRGGIICVDGLLIVQSGQSGVLYLIEPSPKGLKKIAEAKIFQEKSENYMWAPMAFSQGRLVLRDQTSLKCLDLRK